MKEKFKYRKQINYKSVNKSLNNFNTNYTEEISYPRPIFKIDNLDNYSYMTSIIHLLYNISSLYKYYHNKVNSKNDKFSIHLHNTLVYYNNSKKNNIPPDKRIIDITKLSNNLYNINNKFIQGSLQDPVEFLQTIINTSGCADNFYFKNIKIKDECECSESNIFYLDKIQNIFNIPVTSILEISNENNKNIFCNKNKLIYFYKTLISNNYLKKINCPLNGIDCNYNRVTRNIILCNQNDLKESLNYKSLTENIMFNYQYIDEKDSNNNNYNNIMCIHKNINLLNLLLLIPFSFDPTDLFEFENNESNETNESNDNDNDNNKNYIYYLSGLILINNSNYFSCLIKFKNKLVYYNDNEEKIFLNYFQFIQHALKNNLFPYLILYSYKNNNENENENDINNNEYEELYKYASLIDDFKQKKINNKSQLYNVMKIEDDLTLQQSSTECEEKKLSISYNYNNFNINNSNTPIHITKNLDTNSLNNHKINLKKKNFGTNIKNSRRELMNSNINDNFYSEKDRSVEGTKKLESFKLSPLSSGNNDFNLRDLQIINNNKSLNLINVNENKDKNYMIHSAKVYPLQLTEEKIKPFLINNNNNNFNNKNLNAENYHNNKMTKQITDINLINSIDPPEMWICQNCNKVNKALDYKCRLCKLINKKQQKIINVFNSLSLSNCPEDNCNNNVLTTNNNNNISNNNLNKKIRANSGRLYINHKINNSSNIITKKVKCACYTEMKDKLIKNNICILCGREVRNSSWKRICPIKTNNNVFMNKTSSIFYGKKTNNNNKFHSQTRLNKAKSSEKIKIKNKRKNKIELINKDIFKEYKNKMKNENSFSTQSIK